ncbi:diguanylate cyclase (GGDEF) domain-containing protein [Duganella sp. CF402]|uniref:GGDEF domain-containing protein n=1 Tax=unclassified Duganella TaxID=2636909 RepID=UPI0008B227D0|nr:MULTISPECIES: GGDEF domain-containing protein [unclassified Duganella]RZT09734.1 diguanylate cyclase (GGDEF)-like protein [Duganella sp. BK701]SEL45116.1 diguanylate cyclase (GGDEF) domain-containing protein [Duganella sp. CF402]
MSYEIVHTFGFTVYFVFLLFFLWISRFARTSSGAGWWALSLALALCGRLALFLMLPSSNVHPATFIYAIFIVLEKPFLLTGLTRFLNLDLRERWFWLAAAIAELWIMLTWMADAPNLMRSGGYTLVNAAFLAYVAWLAFRHRHDVPGWALTMTAASSAALAVHWLVAPYIIAVQPLWFRNGFVLGTMLVLLQYSSLLSAILLRFQKRLVDAEARALGMAFLDPLTGLKNKRYMETLFDHALLLATRPHQVVAVFYIDLDNFKPINDSAGHAVGDQVLKEVAARLQKHTRSTDICARVGGDEFIVIGTQLENPDQAYEIAKKLLDQLTAEIPAGGASYALGASIGISLYPIHGTQLADLIERADKAMYQVKRNGKSGYEIYDAR